MNRKAFLERGIILAGGLAFLPYLPGCKNTLDNTSGVLSDIVEIIIPQTQTPGGKALGLHHFVVKMVEDCGDDAQQQIYKDGLKEFSSLFQKQNKKDFSEASMEDQTLFLEEINNKESNLNPFFSLVKGLTIKGYTNSKYYMTDIVPYELVPARYNAFYKIA